MRRPDDPLISTRSRRAQRRLPDAVPRTFASNEPRSGASEKNGLPYFDKMLSCWNAVHDHHVIAIYEVVRSAI